MNIKYFKINFLLVLFFVISFSFVGRVDAVSFTKDLKVGVSDTEVMSLQKVLNEDGDTLVSTEGPGSSGNETMYFGEKTKVAIIKFQQKYASDILVPAGLSSGTGFVGSLTRKKLNDLFAGSDLIQTQQTVAPVVTQQNPLNTTDFTDSTTPQKFTIAFANRAKGKSGDKITLFGSGFVGANSVFFGESAGTVTEINPQGNEIGVLVPSLANGDYKIKLFNGKAFSNSVDFNINNRMSGIPTIESVLPAVATVGDTVTVYGQNFSLTNNAISTGFGSYSYLTSPDGNTISFTVKYPDYLKESFSTFSGQTFSNPVQVINGGGRSDVYTNFQIQFP